MPLEEATLSKFILAERVRCGRAFAGTWKYLFLWHKQQKSLSHKAVCKGAGAVCKGAGAGAWRLS